MKGFKKLKFQSVIPQDILQAVELLEKLGYEAEWDFSSDDAATHNGVCAWDDGEITEGWLDDCDFKQVTLDDLKGMSGMVERCESFIVSWEKVFGEKFVDSVSKAVGQNKDRVMKNDKFTLERLLGCEVKINYSGVTGYVTDINNNGHFLHVCCGSSFDIVSKHQLTFFTEDGDELTFDEYVNMYYGEQCEHI